MIDFFNKYAANLTYSQCGEEGILIECLSRIKDVNKVCTEVGANNGIWLSNTAMLCKEGWTGKMVESVHSLWQECQKNWEGYPNVTCTNSHVDAYNINAFVNEKCDVLSIDTDGQDYNIFKALKAKPKIVIIEIDSSIPPTEDRFNSEGGAGYKPMAELALAKGYFLLAHTGNLVLIDDKYKKLFPDISGDPLINHDLYFKKDWLKAA